MFTIAEITSSRHLANQRFIIICLMAQIWTSKIIFAEGGKPKNLEGNPLESD